MNKAISVVLLSLFASLFQEMPVANAAGVPTWNHPLTPSPGWNPVGIDSQGSCVWDMRLNDNDSPITGFYVTVMLTSYDASASRTFRFVSNDANVGTLSTTRLILTKNFIISMGAALNTTYYFYVKPVNAIGTGAVSSDTNNGVTGAGGSCSYSSGTAPGAPGTPTAVPGDGKATVTISSPSTGNSPSSYTVTAFDNTGTTAISPAKTCTVTVPNTSCEVLGLPNGASYTFKSTATNALGTSAVSSPSTAITLTGPVAPTITSVTSSTANGSYKVGQTVSIQVTFSEAVTVTGTPQLTLETGATDQVVNYASGTGTSTLNFSYVIQAGDTSGDLTYVATNSLALNSGTIKNSASLDGVLTLPSPAATGSLGANKSILVDTTLPTVTGFSSTTVDGSYKAGASINITATLSEIVATAASITVTLSNGQTVVLTHNSETNTLTGSYTVGAGQSSADLGVSSYALTTAPADIAGNVMTSTTMPDGNISGTRAIVVDTTLPTVSSFSSTTADGAYKVGSTINITATLSEAVTAAASITVTLDNGKTVVLTHNAVNNTLTGTYTVAAGDTSADLTVSSYALTSAPVDAASNIMTDTTVPSGANNIADTKAIVIDTTAPSTPSTPDLATASDSAGTSDTDNITSDSTPTINVSTSSGTAVVTATKGSSSVSCTISSTSCTLGTLADGVWSLTVTDTDAAGNATTSTALSITVDATAPTPTVATVSVTTSTGVTVRSSEIGTAYLVKSDVSVSSLTSITGAGDNNFNQVTIATANTDTAMSTAGLDAGTYKLYVVDAGGNLSLVSTNTVTVAVAAAPTANSTAAPTGTTTFGSTLTNAVTFNGVPTPTLTYQWKSCTNATDTATVCSDISGATGSSFIANAIELVGKFIRVLVTAINGESPNATAWSSPTAAITAVAPGVPTLGTPTLGNLQINVPVTAPASNGGSTITKYQFSTDGGASWRDRTDTATVSSPIVIKFLSTDGTTPIVAGTAYPIQIRAVNSATPGDGSGTTSVSVTAATAPSAPTAVSATATGQTTATVSFTAPASNGGSVITSYTVISSPGGVTATGSTSPITVSALTASTAYTFTVTATNAAATSIASAASTSVTTSAPAPVTVAPPAPEPEPEPVCNASCVAAQNAAAKAAADKVIADKAAAEAKVIAEKVASDTAAKVVADKVVVDKSAAEAAAKAAVDKAVSATVAKAAADAAAAQAAVVAKAASDAQAAAVDAANKAAAALKSATASAATKAAATATAAKAATTAANAVKAAATAAKTAATAKTTASNAKKQVDIALGALSSKTAAATTAAQANAIAAAAKAAANEAAKVASDQAAAAKVASNNANKEATATAANIAIEQKQAADAAAAAKVASDAVLKATEEKISAATEAQKAAEAVVKALEEKIALAESSVKAKDITERAAIDKKIAEVTVKVTEAQTIANTANAKADAATVAQESAQAVATTAAQNAATQAAEAVAVKAESIAKTAVATKAAADASLAAKIATAAVAAAAKVPSKAVISSKPSTSTNKNSAKATISGLKPGQKVKVTVNVKGK